MAIPALHTPRRTPRRTASQTEPDPAPPATTVTLDHDAPEVSTQSLGDVERARALQQAVQHASTHGAQVVSTAAHVAFIDHRLTPAHRRHVQDSGCDACSWASALMLVPALALGRRRRLQLTVDEFGVVTSRPAPNRQH